MDAPRHQVDDEGQIRAQRVDASSWYTCCPFPALAYVSCPLAFAAVDWRNEAEVMDARRTGPSTGAEPCWYRAPLALLNLVAHSSARDLLSRSSGLQDSQLEVLAIAVALLSVVIALSGVAFALRGDRRKNGVEVRCDFSVSSSIFTAERWVSNVVLENRKDRSLGIYRIYLEVGHGTYVTVDDLEEEPLVLEPYEVKHLRYDPVEFYAVNDKRVAGVWRNPDSRLRLLLVTSQGRHYAKRGIDRMGPFLDVLSRELPDGRASPYQVGVRRKILRFECEVSCQSNWEFGGRECVANLSSSIQNEPFPEFDLTDEVLSSKESLEHFLQGQIASGILEVSDAEVVEMDPLRKERFSQYTDLVELPHHNWFTHHILGKVWTLWQRRLRISQRGKSSS